MGDWPSFLDEAGPLPGLSGAADEARDRLVETFVKYIHEVVMGTQKQPAAPSLDELWNRSRFGICC